MSSVHVKGISSQTSEKEVRDFFSFCGKIQSLSVKPETGDSGSSQSATVTFEKETAAKTALLLDNTQLGPSQVNVTAASSLDDLSGSKAAGSSEDDEIPQEEKPRARVAAEMLAHGYVLSDQAIQRALALDQQHGISTRFQKALTDFDSKFKVTERAQQADKSYGVSARADAGWRGINSYFEKALGTPTGQKLRAFYEQGSKQVLDVHNEAKHLATLKKGKAGPPHDVGNGRTECDCQGATGICTCKPGDCACSKCGLNPSEKTTNRTPEEANMEKVQVDGKEKTKCNCGADESSCPCEPGKCACASCPKAS